MGDLSNNFSRSEFACKCGCGLDSVSSHLITLLQIMRDKLNSSIIIISGCRCQSHNSRYGGGPAHLPTAEGVCEAVDIATPDFKTLDKLIRYSYELGIRRRGVNNGSLHLDIREDLPQDVTWTYYKKKEEKK